MHDGDQCCTNSQQTVGSSCLAGAEHLQLEGLVQRKGQPMGKPRGTKRKQAAASWPSWEVPDVEDADFSSPEAASVLYSSAVTLL